MFEAGEVYSAVRHQFVDDRVAGLDAFGEFDDGVDTFAHLVVGDADDGDVGDRRVDDERGLDLLRVDVDAAGEDEVATPVGQVEVAVGVEMAEVTDGLPAARVAGVLGLGGIVEVSELPGCGEEHRPDLTGGEFVARVVEDVDRAVDGASDRAGMFQPLR